MATDGWKRLNAQVQTQQAQIAALVELVSELNVKVLTLEAVHLHPE